MAELTQERLAELRRTQYSPLEALRQHIDGAGGLRERMDEGDVTAFEADVVMGYDALQDVIDVQADELIRLRRKLVDASDALTWMGNKVTEAFHVLGSEDNPQEALDILYAAYRRYHDELKGRVTDGA